MCTAREVVLGGFFAHLAHLLVGDLVLVQKMARSAPGISNQLERFYDRIYFQGPRAGVFLLG